MQILFPYYFLFFSPVVALSAFFGGMHSTLSEFSTVIELNQPKYHFYAHHSQPIPHATIGKTESYWLHDVNFQKNNRGMYPYGHLNEACIGILSWEDQDNNSFEIINENWMKKITWSSWRSY